MGQELDIHKGTAKYDRMPCVRVCGQAPIDRVPSHCSTKPPEREGTLQQLLPNLESYMILNSRQAGDVRQRSAEYLPTRVSEWQWPTRAREA